jgi:hypothetical protein
MKNKPAPQLQAGCVRRDTLSLKDTVLQLGDDSKPLIINYLRLGVYALRQGQTEP